MHQWEQVLYSVVNPDSEFGATLDEALDELNLSVTEFSEQSGVSESVLYKATSGHRENIQLENFETILRTLKRLEQGREAGEREIAIITNRESLEQIRSRLIVEDVEVTLREYPSSTIEEAIKQSILAERDGVDAIICGPITAYTLENIVYTPVIGLEISSEQVEKAIRLALEKTADIETDD
jgi:predicted transcriptional regulator